MTHAALQRQCACGGTPGPDGECAACKAKRLGLQRLAVAGARETHAPPVVDATLRAPGRPLEPGPRDAMERGFGHDFSRVRVHTDSAAADSARAVGAHAYTVGGDVVFGAGRYAPETPPGRRLLAHELAHVVQQRGASRASGPLAVGPTGGAYEREADRAADTVTAKNAPGPLLSAQAGLQRQPEDAGAPPAVEDEGAAANAAPPPALPAAPPAAPPTPCTPQPVATLDEFLSAGATAAENCCAVCPANLGVTADGMAANSMQMRIEIANPCPGAEYDITRVRESWLWHRVGGAWTELEHQGPGVNDDHHDDDECLRLRRGRFLYVIDSPGYPGIALPAPVGNQWRGYTGVQTDAAATEVVAQDTFAEWVIFRHRNHGIPWTRISTPRFFYWRSVLWLEQDVAGWHLNAANSEVERGFRRAVVRP